MVALVRVLCLFTHSRTHANALKRRLALPERSIRVPRLSNIRQDSLVSIRALASLLAVPARV
jgi:hypothetical protein